MAKNKEKKNKVFEINGVLFEEATPPFPMYGIYKRGYIEKNKVLRKNPTFFRKKYKTQQEIDIYSKPLWKDKSLSILYGRDDTYLQNFWAFMVSPKGFLKYKLEKRKEKKNTKSAEAETVKVKDRVVPINGITKAAGPRGKFKIAYGAAKVVLVALTSALIWWNASQIKNGTIYVDTNHDNIHDSFEIPDGMDEIPVDKDGNIDPNPTTPEDKENLARLFNEKVLGDCEKMGVELDTIDEILSISLLPLNECELDNEFDNNLLTILFSSNNEIYCKNYVVGRDVEYLYDISKKDKENVIEFISFLENCANDACYKMNNEQSKALDKLSDAMFVGASYESYDIDGNLSYATPVFSKDGSVTIYTTENSIFINSTSKADELFCKNVSAIVAGQDVTENEIVITFGKIEVEANEDFEKLANNLSDIEAEIVGDQDNNTDTNLPNDVKKDENEEDLLSL